MPARRLGMPMNAPHLSTWLAGQSPGAIVPTTIRFELQSALSQLVDDERGQLADKAQIALVAIDNRTGDVVAWLGGSDFFGRAGQVDLVRAHRSPGSALKPMIYALAFDDRTLHPDSLVEDVPVRFKDWLPRNFDRDHQGAVTVRRALQQSLNVPAVLALEKVGPQRFIATLRAAGAAPGLPPGDTGASLGMALGSAAISPLEMAGLYSGLANGGPLRAAHGAPRPAQARAGAPRRPGGRLVRHRHSGRCAAAGGLRLLPVALRERRIAYKTGTSAGFRDAWAAGYRANWTVVVWVGHADGTPRPGQLGRLAALPVLFKAFGRLPGEDNRAQRPPADVMRVASNRDLPLRMRTLGPAAMAEGGPRIAYPPPDCAHRARGARGRAARRQWRQRPAALAGRRQADRRHDMDSRRARHGARRRDRWPGPLERGHGAHRHQAIASGTEASSSSGEDEVDEAVAARLAEEPRQQRARHQPGDVDGGDHDGEQRDLQRDIEGQPVAQQHEAREQRRHRGIALGIDQRQRAARRRSSAARAGPPLRSSGGAVAMRQASQTK